MDEVPKRCGQPAIHYYQWLTNGAYFARCEEHKNNTGPNDNTKKAREYMTAAEKIPVSKDEFLVADVMES